MDVLSMFCRISEHSLLSGFPRVMEVPVLQNQSLILLPFLACLLWFFSSLLLLLCKLTTLQVRGFQSTIKRELETECVQPGGECDPDGDPVCCGEAASEEKSANICLRKTKTCGKRKTNAGGKNGKKKVKGKAKKR